MNRTLSTALAALLLAAPAFSPALRAEPAEARPVEEVYLIEPGFPADLEDHLRRHLLDELAENLQDAFPGSLRVRQSPSAGALVVRSTRETRAGAVTLVKDLTERMLPHLDALRATMPGPSLRGMAGEALEVRVQIALASRKPSRDAPLPPKLTQALGEMLGFRSFRVVGQASAKGVANEEIALETEIPLGAGRPLKVGMELTPGYSPKGHDLIVKAGFQVHEVGDPQGKRPVHTSLRTTYRPRAGVPLVIGASPLDDAESLVFLVTHSGPAVE